MRALQAVLDGQHFGLLAEINSAVGQRELMAGAIQARLQAILVQRDFVFWSALHRHMG